MSDVPPERCWSQMFFLISVNLQAGQTVERS